MDFSSQIFFFGNLFLVYRTLIAIRDSFACLILRKKKGHKPTGMLVYAAKATGLGSASNLIQVKGVENLDNFKRPVLLKKVISLNMMYAYVFLDQCDCVFVETMFHHAHAGI